ncbi:MAG TPA: 4-hydroxyphenylpyruvate dioxygenase [Acidimicrobiales bacterium]|nr:4-hydroxyphenylpyruvate dioxygenase [Acidimicrobiales bacterium]
MTTTEISQASTGWPAPPVLGGIDHLEWWVGNARAFTGFLESAFGFDVVAYAGPETGRRDRVSYLLEQGRVRFMVSGALSPDSPIAAHVRQHGDGVRDICFLVDDVSGAYEAALARGATSERQPATDTDPHGSVHHAAIRAYGETVHTFLDRTGYTGPFAPQFEPTDLRRPVGPEVGITRLDHVVANVERGRLDQWVGYYEDVLGFEQLTHFSEDQISTEYSALMSTVVWNHDKVVLPINEPAEGRRKSQIEEYLDFYGSPGVQHVALHTPDIVSTVEALRDRGVRFMDVPAEYYDDARTRLEGVDLPWEALAPLGILVDRDHEGHLLQIFTETVTDRPTVFFEIIQREGARGFGEGNFKALFESIERAQARRGNL